MAPDVPSPTDVYGRAVATVEQALAEAARAQWAGSRPDLHVFRRALIEARRSVPNDRLDPVAQVVRDLLTAYVAVLDEQAQHDVYRREGSLSPTLQAELDRLRRRAARLGLPVLDERLEFRRGAARDARPSARPSPPPASGPPRRRRQSRA